jgi:hypothetical protein
VWWISPSQGVHFQAIDDTLALKLIATSGLALSQRPKTILSL